MPRKPRIDAPGALHHVMGRGIEGVEIYRSDGDRDDFLSRLETVLGETKARCFAWALIPNHFHLLIRTGKEPLSALMRRLLTGYSVAFNRRYERKGHLFQNRYRSILCQEDAYLLELVRYIHLNPLRAGQVMDLAGLDSFPYSGHSALMGSVPRPWQDTEWVLRLYGENGDDARRGLRRFMQAGIKKGSRPELAGYSPSRRTAAGKGRDRRLGPGRRADERILGDNAFVEDVLKACEERSERRRRLRETGVSFERLVQRVSDIMDLDEWQVLKPSKERPRVKARSLLCFWAAKELGMTMTEVAERLTLSVSAVSQLVNRGEHIAAMERYELLESAAVS
jgi:REP element-mobilizing transposase RayT